ncbi:MAG: UDPGP type 1 family protein [Planctomycetota bacterium]
MIRVEAPQDQVNVAKVYEVGQEQVFEYWEDLSPEERRSLLSQISNVDFQEFARLVRGLQENGDSDHDTGLEQLEAMPMILLPATDKARSERALAQRIGDESLRRGECGVFLVAGGQGTRLRMDGPKGMFPIGPVTDRPLFQFHAEQILATQRRAKRSIPWFIMTSPGNDEATRNFFADNNHFGLNPADVSFHPQGMLPVVDRRRGRILMNSPHEIALSPNGHGGATAVIRSLSETLERRGIRHLFYHQVDNPLLHICDPTFLGYHILSESQFSSKAVAKVEPEEKIGVFARSGGAPTVVEYSELNEEQRHAVDETGALMFRAGNVASHVISTDLLCTADGQATFEMPYHLAHKATAHLRNGELVEPTEPNSIKFESFLFDVLPHARNPVVLEVDRAEEFAPVKNFTGNDSPETCRRAMTEKWSRWLERAGTKVPRTSDGAVATPLEISPLYATTAAELEERVQGEPPVLQGEGLLLQ